MVLGGGGSSGDHMQSSHSISWCFGRLLPFSLRLLGAYGLGLKLRVFGFMGGVAHISGPLLVLKAIRLQLPEP